MARTTDDPFQLERFLQAQAGAYPPALAELRAGAKRSHWMWFVFPQLRGLGRSDMARAYGIVSLDEARAYLAHPVLGARLREVMAVLSDLAGADAEAVFGPVDAVKLRSCVTLFQAAAPQEPLFGAVLAKYFGGRPDGQTLALLAPTDGRR
ncbi:DUF1810 domain-containing protein [Aquabacterium sp. J223]|uniref:DUF1810 domain-containing protein n=1 Tax=Aquabacterium sp. J223 TaxID=2898431 RepID=UPI0021ADCB3D|nr:DUF1810 domain-containing protein [Aquabacterium sp. J223]UUX95656.1 DUF1810 domain-containing protein [Aquabacterium sp. J223]